MYEEEINMLPNIEGRILHVKALIDKTNPEIIQNTLEMLYGKRYGEHEILTAYNNLIKRGLVEKVDEYPTFRLTKKGLRVARRIDELAESKPDPFRRFTRESYSQNT